MSLSMADFTELDEKDNFFPSGTVIRTLKSFGGWVLASRTKGVVYIDHSIPDLRLCQNFPLLMCFIRLRKAHG